MHYNNNRDRFGRHGSLLSDVAGISNLNVRFLLNLEFGMNTRLKLKVKQIDDSFVKSLTGCFAVFAENR